MAVLFEIDLSKPSHYATLGVDAKDFSEEQLKKNFRLLALKWHPDRHTGDGAKAEAERRFKEVSAAYTALTSGGGAGFAGAGEGGGARPREPAGGPSGYGGTGAGGRGGGGGGGEAGGWRNPGRMTPDEFTRAQADRVFREFFGRGDFQRVMQDVERMMRHEMGRRGAGAGGRR